MDGDVGQPEDTTVRRPTTGSMRAVSGSVPVVPGGVTRGSVKDGDLANPMELDEFLMQVGILLRLPAKTTERPIAAAKAAVRVVRRNRKLLSRLLPVTAAALVSTYAAVNVKLPSSQTPTVPDELVGVWTTTDARYAGRRMTFDAKTFVLTRGPVSGDVGHQVVSIDRQRKGQSDTTIYVVRYLDEGGEQEMSLRHVGGARPFMTFANQQQVEWRWQARTVTEFTGRGGK
jgi:hypothetical protein